MCTYVRVYVYVYVYVYVCVYIYKRQRGPHGGLQVPLGRHHRDPRAAAEGVKARQ